MILHKNYEINGKYFLKSHKKLLFILKVVLYETYRDILKKGMTFSSYTVHSYLSFLANSKLDSDLFIVIVSSNYPHQSNTLLIKD